MNGKNRKKTKKKRSNNSKKYVEAIEFKKAITNSKIFLHTDDNDLIWDKVCEKVRKIDHERKNSIFEDRIHISHESPFIQGDSPNQPKGLPDIIYEDNNYVLGIEHFQFDASKVTRKGSDMLRAEKEVDTIISEKIKSTKERPIHVELPVKTVFSYQTYIQSLLTVFKKHAKNIPKYLSSLSQKYPDKKIMLAFYIEDKTALGNILYTNRGIEIMNPLCVKEFLDELSLHMQLSYIITKIKKEYLCELHIQKLDQDFLQSLYTETYNIDEDVYCPYTYKKEVGIYSLKDDSAQTR